MHQGKLGAHSQPAPHNSLPWGLSQHQTWQQKFVEAAH